MTDEFGNLPSCGSNEVKKMECPRTPPRSQQPPIFRAVNWNDTDRRRDPYHGLATIHDSDISISPTSVWDLNQVRVWPPIPYQPYCVKHFIQECLVYYSLEREKLGLESIQPGSVLSKADKVRRPLKKPTRIQPARKAKKVASTTSSTSKQRKRTSGKHLDSAWEGGESLQLHLPWPMFKSDLETLITQVAEKLYANRERTKSMIAAIPQQADGSPEYLGEGSDVYAHPKCPFCKPIQVECRYCQHRPRSISSHNLRINKPVPLAPMHLIWPDEVEKDQICQFGGLSFAVDICSGEERIVLIGLDMVDSSRTEKNQAT